MPVELEENAVLELDVTADNGRRVLSKRILNGKDLVEIIGSVRVDFELNDVAADRVEFRAFGTGADFFMINACRTVYDSSRKQIFVDRPYQPMRWEDIGKALRAWLLAGGAEGSPFEAGCGWASCGRELPQGGYFGGDGLQLEKELRRFAA